MAVMIQTQYGYRPMAGTVLDVNPTGETFESVFVPQRETVTIGGGVSSALAETWNNIAVARHNTRCMEDGAETRYRGDPPKVKAHVAVNPPRPPVDTLHAYRVGMLLAWGDSTDQKERTRVANLVLPALRSRDNIAHTGFANRRDWTNGAE